MRNPTPCPSGQEQELACRGPRLDVDVRLDGLGEGIPPADVHLELPAVIDRYQSQGVHCPLGVLITEVGRSTPAAQAVIRQLIEQWQNAVQAGIIAMQQHGQITTDLDAARTAAAIIAAIQGGVTILMSTGSSAHLEAALDTSLAYLRR
jgi:ABC-type phosphate transport system substrate-binding protein